MRLDMRSSLKCWDGNDVNLWFYISKKENLTSTALSIAAADTMIALLAGLAIFPAVFALWH